MRKPNNARPSLKMVAAKGTPAYTSELAVKLRNQSSGKLGTIALRQRKISALANLGTVEARKERKAMNVHHTGKLVPTNVKGMYGKQHPCKAKVNGKNRPCLSAMKAIMSRRAG